MKCGLNLLGRTTIAALVLTVLTLLHTPVVRDAFNEARQKSPHGRVHLACQRATRNLSDLIADVLVMGVHTGLTPAGNDGGLPGMAPLQASGADVRFVRSVRSVGVRWCAFFSWR